MNNLLFIQAILYSKLLLGDFSLVAHLFVWNSIITAGDMQLMCHAGAGVKNYYFIESNEW